MSTAFGTMSQGVFMGEVNAIIMTMNGESVTAKGSAVGYPSENGGISRSATTQTTQAEKLKQLNKVICLHEYITDMADNWTGKIWVWK
jgi:hypothetical protein